MAQMRLLRETSRIERRPARVLEGTIHDYRDQIRRHLQLRGLDRQAALFALPNPVSDRMQWYTDLDGPIRPLTGLAADEQRLAAADTAALLEDIEREAARLAAERDTAQQTLSRLLASALEGGGLADVVLVGEQPVLAGWGLRPVDSLDEAIGAGARDLLGQLRSVARPAPVALAVAAQSGPGAPPPRPQATSPPSRVTWLTAPRRLIRQRWPLRLLGIVVAVLAVASAIAWLLPGLVASSLAAFRLPVAPVCDVAQSQGAGLLPLQEEDARLRGRMAELEREAGRRALQCRIAAAGPGPSVEERKQDAGARAGKVEVTLEWNGLVDLDLHILCPSGEQIGFNSRQACGGELDVDMNANPAHMSPTPVEHITWADKPPSGTYRVLVHYFDYARQQTPMRFNVYVEIDGHRREVSGEVNENTPQAVTEFSVP